MISPIHIFQIFKVYSKSLLVLIITGLLIFILLLNQSDRIFQELMQNVKEGLFPPSIETTQVQNIIIGGLQEMDELRTASLKTKATVKKTQDRKISRLKIGDTTVIYEGIGQIEAGIDMKDLKVKNLDIAHRKIHLLLPAPHLAETFLDIHSSRTIDQYKRGLGKNVESQLQEKAQKEVLAIIQAEACANGILDKANKNAQSIVKNILTKAGFQEIIIESQTPLKGSCRIT